MNNKLIDDINFIPINSNNTMVERFMWYENVSTTINSNINSHPTACDMMGNMTEHIINTKHYICNGGIYDEILDIIDKKNKMIFDVFDLSKITDITLQELQYYMVSCISSICDNDYLKQSIIISNEKLIKHIPSYIKYNFEIYIDNDVEDLLFINDINNIKVLENNGRHGVFIDECDFNVLRINCKTTNRLKKFKSIIKK